MPIQPLLDVVASRGGFAAVLARAVGDGPGCDRARWRLERAWYRGLAAGRLTPMAGDSLAVSLLGVTPWTVWGLAWDEYDVYAADVAEPRRRSTAATRAVA